MKMLIKRPHITVTVLLLLFAGCTTELREETIPVQVEHRVEPEPRPEQLASRNPEIQRRFTDDLDNNEQSAVERALEWSEKYQQLSIETAKLREENTELKLTNRDLQSKIENLQLQLDQAKAELEDANKFLADLQLELTKWKRDVLGFRDEIKTAQAAQLKALAKILRLLGAESVDLSNTDMSTPASEEIEDE